LAGVMLVAIGLLAQRGGAVMFFLAMSLALLLGLVVPGLLAWRRARRSENEAPLAEPGTGGATIVSMLMIAGIIGVTLGDSTTLRAATPKGASVPPVVSIDAGGTPALPDGTKPAQAMIQTWSIRGDRLFAEMDLTVRGVAGDSFLLLRPPAVLTDFKGDGLRVAKVERDGKTAYYVAPERDGLLTARVRFELSIPDRTKPLSLPTGPAAVQRVTIDLDQGGWEFVSPMAVQVLPATGANEDRSGATLVLAPHSAPTIQLQPRRRDLGAEATQFFAEAAPLRAR